jgi:hypothetical protein
MAIPTSAATASTARISEVGQLSTKTCDHAKPAPSATNVSVSATATATRHVARGDRFRPPGTGLVSTVTTLNAAKRRLSVVSRRARACAAL